MLDGSVARECVPPRSSRSVVALASGERRKGGGSTYRELKLKKLQRTKFFQ